MIIRALQVLGGLAIMLAYLPQVYQVIKTGSARDLNLKAYFLSVTGVGCMEVYGVNMLLQFGVGRLFLLTNTVSLFLLAGTTILVAVLKSRESGRHRRWNGVGRRLRAHPWAGRISR